MRLLGEYIVSVSAAAIVCSVLYSLMPKGTAKEILRMVAGLFLVFTVIQPIRQLNLPDLSAILDMHYAQAEEASALGEEMAQDSVSERIKQELEAYILDKAETLRLNLTVHVTLDETTNFPLSVCLSGETSPLSRKQMIRFLTEELGIQEENIQWTQ